MSPSHDSTYPFAAPDSDSSVAQPMFEHEGTTIFLSEIEAAFRSMGLRQGDTCMIHSSLFPFGRPLVAREQLMDRLLASLMNILGPEGTLILPTYNFEFCKGEPFDVDASKSTCGVLTEYFRSLPGVVRTAHPIYSHAILGPRAKELADANNEDCFGEGTFFDVFLKLKGKAMSMGAPFPPTFKHYIEQSFGVPYRYLKTFTGTVIQGESRSSARCSFYVRNLDDDLVKDSGPMRAMLVQRGVLKTSSIGGATLSLIDSRDMLRETWDMLEKDVYALMKRKEC